MADKRFKGNKEYEDIYSNTTGGADGEYNEDNQSQDIYIGDKKYQGREIYIGRKAQREQADIPTLNGRYATRKIPKLSDYDDSAPKKLIKRDNAPLTEDEISDFESRRKRKKGRPFLILVCVLLVIVIGLGGFTVGAVNGIVDNFEKADEIEHIDGVEDLVSEKHVRNILLIGTDKKTGDSSRSDSIMIASVNSKTGKITLASILRDTHVEIPGKREAKINAAYSWGGANLLIQTIELNFGIKIDDYATVNFEMFEKLVDGIGGIYVDVSEAEAEHLNNHFKLGREGKHEKIESGKDVYLDGYLALCYARIRKLDSDFYRTERQQKIIKAIAENVKERLTLSGIPELLKIAEDVAPYIETTLSQDDFWHLIIDLVGSFLKNEGKTNKMLVSAQIPFEGTWWYSDEWDGSSISLNLDENKELLYTYLYDEDFEPEEGTEDETD